MVLGNVGTADDVGFLEHVRDAEPDEMVRDHLDSTLTRLRY